MDARPGVEVRREVPGDAPPAPPPPAVMPPADKLPEVMPRVAPRVDPKVEPVVPQGPEPPVVERVPSKAPAVPQGTPFLTRQPSPSPSSPSSTVVKQRQPTRPVDLGTSIPLVLPAPQVPPQNVPTPGYCDDPRFANTELCYKGGVPASQGRGPMAVIEKGNPEIKGASVVERVPGVLNVPNLNFKGAAGPSHAIVGPMVGQYRPARGPSLSIERSSIPASQYMPGQGLLPVSNYMPPSPIKGVSGLAGAGAGVPRSRRGHNTGHNPSQDRR
jgi:hypothetical protein